MIIPIQIKFKYVYVPHDTDIADQIIPYPEFISIEKNVKVDTTLWLKAHKMTLDECGYVIIANTQHPIDGTNSLFIRDMGKFKIGAMINNDQVIKYIRNETIKEVFSYSCEIR